MDLQNNASVLELWLDLLTWNAIVAFSEQCEAKLVHVVLLLYLASTRTLAIGSCKSDKRAAKLHLVSCCTYVLSSRLARPFADLELFQQRSGRSFPIFVLWQATIASMQSNSK